MIEAPRQLLLDLYGAALAAVGGRAAVARWLRRYPQSGPLHVIALGKAAAAMTQGALDVLGDSIVSGIVVTREGYGDRLLSADSRLRLLEAAHPVPDARSIAAGEALVEFCDDAPADARFLVLISGGTSSLVELPAPGIGADGVAELNRWLLGSGLDIHAMNRIRRACSRIKGGRLAAHLRGRPTQVLLISDVRGDRIASIGSGPLAPSEEAPVQPAELPVSLRHLLADIPPVPPPESFSCIRHAIVASNAQALAAAQDAANRAGLPAQIHPEFLTADAVEAGRDIAETLAAAEPGVVHLWGGEPVVRLPAQPGRGGRMQALALSAACSLGEHCYLLAAGTDGADGPNEDAGAIVDGDTVARLRAVGIDAAEHLQRADAGTALAASEALITTGPTGTNVMDVVIGLRVADE